MLVEFRFRVAISKECKPISVSHVLDIKILITGFFQDLKIMQTTPRPNGCDWSMDLSILEPRTTSSASWSAIFLRVLLMLTTYEDHAVRLSNSCVCTYKSATASADGSSDLMKVRCICEITLNK